MVPAPAAAPPAQPARSKGQVARGRGQIVRGRGQAARGGGLPVRGHPRDMVQGGGAQPRCYAFSARPEAESSDDVITSTVSVCSRDASFLFDPGSTYSYVSYYFASYLVIPRDSLSAPIYVSTPVWDAIVADRVYRSCVVVIGGLETSVDLLLLDMVDFDVILGMDWVSPYHAILLCHTKRPGLPRLEWRGTPGHSSSRVTSYMKARRMVEKGCLAYLAYVHDSSAEVPSMDSVHVVREFPEARILVPDPGTGPL
ncbi:uncharacterized protein [Nicotiana tomentosiformis]|uniref:uncharacterized protein n=1 Tax=Nicotiana tomentosiformis TaxID=4098 RepID=UPI00388C6A66